MNVFNSILDDTRFPRIAYFDNEVRLSHADIKACAQVLIRFPAHVQGAQQGISILEGTRSFAA